MYGLNIDPTNERGNPSAQELVDLGVEWVRFSYIDPSSGPSPDPERFKLYKGKVEEYRAKGILSLVILHYNTFPNPPAYGADEAEWAVYTDYFISRVGQIAGSLGAWCYQVWNEPDLKPQPGYIPSLEEKIYGEILHRAYSVIKTVSPAGVIGAGLCSGDPGYWQRVAASQPDVTLIDVLAIHPYGQRPSPDWPSSTWGFSYLGNLINNYRIVWPGPLWISECGTDTLTDEEQAEYLRRFYNEIKTKFAGIVWEVAWFCYSNGMVRPFGLLDENGQRKPAYEAYQKLRSE